MQVNPPRSAGYLCIDRLNSRPDSGHSGLSKRQTLCPSLEHHLKVDAVRIDHVGSSVTDMVVMAYSGRPIFTPACSECGTMKFVDRFAAPRFEGHMGAVADALASMEPD